MQPKSRLKTIPKRNITSTDITGFSGGLNLLGEFTAKANEIVEARNVVLTSQGKLTQRNSLRRWLPDTVGDVYQISTNIMADGSLIHFTADDGKIKWIKPGMSDWVDCTGDNTITTGNRVKNTFVRVQNKLIGMNGVDKIYFVDIEDKTVTKPTPVADPTKAPTAISTGLEGTNHKIYYGYTFSTATGETKLSPILTHNISKHRDVWDSKTEYVTISRPADNPKGAKNWNLYIALASNGGTIQDSDMLMVAGGLDMNTTQIMDNGLLAIDISRGTAPEYNSTDGFKATHGIETNGRPVLFGDGYNIWIGGDGEHALDFSPTHGGYRLEPNKGTDYRPTSVIGFRNGQGVPSLTVLFSNVDGLSKQATLEQQTISYGEQSFVVWGVTEQNYGAAGATSFYSVVNYKGALHFVSTDGILRMDTQPQLQNVISTSSTTSQIAPYLQNIKNSALKEIVGTAWSDKFYFLMPSNGADTPNQILVADTNNNGAYYTMNIVAQWIGTVSPHDSPAFVYVCKGNKIYKLHDSFGTIDGEGAEATPFSCYAKGAFIGFNDAHNAYAAVAQAVFRFTDWVGNVTVGVNYRDQNDKIKTKQKTFKGPQYKRLSVGGWGDPQLVYNHDAPAGWGAVPRVDTTDLGLQPINKKMYLPVNDVASGAQWWYETEFGFTSHQLNGVSYEGRNLGIKPNIR